MLFKLKLLASKIKNKLYDINYNIIIRLEKYLPIKRNIVFECESDMDDNPRAVYEYLIEQGYNKKHKLIWIVKNVELCKAKHLRKNVVFISRFNDTYKNKIKLNYYLSTSKWFIFSHPYWFKKKRKNQIVVNIDHGLPIKKPRSDAEYLIAKTYDYIICPSFFMKNIYFKRYRCDESQLLDCGYPRNDYLLKTDKSIFNKFFQYNNDSKVIMCMPTFKQAINNIDSDVKDDFCLDVVTDLMQMEYLNNFLVQRNMVLIIKPHPLQRIDVLKLRNYSNIHYIFNSNILDKNQILYKIIGSCDALISDISSICYDYVLCDKPIAYFMNNFKNYQRGCIWDKADFFMHGERIYSFDQLLAFLDNTILGVDKYKIDRRSFLDLIWGNNRINSCKKFTEWLFDK